MSALFASLFMLASTAHAVPGQFTHQGRLLDDDGTPMEGEPTIVFRVIDAEMGGTILWEDSLTVTLNNGFYAVVLGANEDENPLDTDVLQKAPVWLELQITGGPAMFPRSPIHAVPYATIATVASSVSGGTVDATQISIDGTPVVDAAGNWVGPEPTVSWDTIEDVPAELTESSDALTELGLSCIDGDVPVWNDASMDWTCDTAKDTLESLACDVGAIAVQTESGWACSTIAEQMDGDEDGVPIWSDCDDTDASAGSNIDDADCDGIETDMDCDDENPDSTTKYVDFDCDGIETDMDCDDTMGDSTVKANDADCDGIETDMDCDDEDPDSTTKYVDFDCDGIPSTYDCQPSIADATLDASALVGASSDCPIASCIEAQNIHELFFSDTPWEGGEYHLGGSDASDALYCEPADDGGAPWTHVLKFDAQTDACPDEWTTKTMDGYSMCARNDDGVRTHTFSVPAMEFDEMQANINGAIENSLDGFQLGSYEGLTGIYGDGVGVRMGSTHLYTFVIGHDGHHCSPEPPGFVGSNHVCTLVDYSSGYSGPYGTDWRTVDGVGPHTTSDISVQLMADQDIDDEDIAVLSVGIKVR